MAKFDIGSFAASLNETVSKLDTNAEPQLRYVDIDLLDANETNFYDVSKLDTLADSIAMDGLQQPIVVQAGEGGRYTVLSGHRRRAAIRKLVEEDGREDLRRVPCLVRVYKSQALAELQLIMANSTARVLTSAEVMRQAQRMEQLLYQLKEEGYSFPGRMRAQVAEACQVSESKLARLKVIQDKLIVAWLARFEDGEISEDVAYTIAKMGQDYQVSLAEIFDARGYGVTKNTVEGYRLQLDEIAAIECVHGSACTNRERMIEHTGKSASPYCGTCKTCCASCASRSTSALWWRSRWPRRPRPDSWSWRRPSPNGKKRRPSELLKRLRKPNATENGGSGWARSLTGWGSPGAPPLICGTLRGRTRYGLCSSSWMGRGPTRCTAWSVTWRRSWRIAACSPPWLRQGCPWTMS